MKKLKYILILSLLLVPVSFVRAANDVTTPQDITITLTSMNLTLEKDSTYSSMTISGDTLTFVISAEGSVGIISNDKYTLTNDRGSAVVCEANFSFVHYAAPKGEGDQTIIFSPTVTVCNTSATSGGSGSSGGTSGGGGGSETPAPAGTVAVSKTVGGASGGSVATTDNKAGASAPAGLVSGNLSINITPKASSSYTTPVVGYSAVAGQVYEFGLSVGGSALTQFTKPVTLTFKYTDSEVAGIDESTLKVYYWDAANAKWVLVGGTIDKANNTVTADVTHFTIFGVFGTKTSTEGSGDLIKLACPKGANVNHACKSVYYLASNSKRYVFPNEITYKSWYADFSTVKTISGDVMASYNLGGNVTMRPGTYLIKITTDPKVYAVEAGGKLRWLESEAVAKKLYGSNWLKKIVDVPDTFFINYDSSQAVANKVADKHPVGSLIKYAGTSSKYYVSGGEVKRLFNPASAFAVNGFRDEFVLETDITYGDGAAVTAAETDLNKTAGK